MQCCALLGAAVPAATKRDNCGRTDVPKCKQGHHPHVGNQSFFHLRIREIEGMLRMPQGHWAFPTINEKRILKASAAIFKIEELISVKMAPKQ
jgi:hypothetical protein